MELEARRGGRNGRVVAGSLGRIAGGLVNQHMQQRELTEDSIELEARRGGKRLAGHVGAALGGFAGSFQQRDLEGEVDLEARRGGRRLAGHVGSALGGFASGFQQRDLEDEVDLEARRGGRRLAGHVGSALGGFAGSFQQRDLEDEVDLEARRGGRRLAGHVGSALGGFASSFQQRDLEDAVELEARRGGRNGRVIAGSLGRIAGGVINQHMQQRELAEDSIELEARRGGRRLAGHVGSALGGFASSFQQRDQTPHHGKARQGGRRMNRVQRHKAVSKVAEAEQAREFNDPEMEARRVEDLQDLLTRSYTDLD